MIRGIRGLSPVLADAAAAYDQAAVLAREVGARMAERLDYMKIAPRRMADIGCATGDGIRDLQARYPKAQPLAIDLAMPMLHGVRGHDHTNNAPWKRLFKRSPQLINADMRALPLADNTLDLVWSNLMLHWLDDPLPALREIHRALNTSGLVMFATLGPDSLLELREAAKKIGADDTAKRFPDMHDIGDMLVASGFADPVMDMEMITLTYRHPRQFLADQRHLGARDHLLGAQTYQAWRRIFKAWARDADGRLPLRFEIVYGHAWKPALRETPKRDADGNAIIKFHPR
ncbi:MAG: methyltransferase domain-containing protein [Rugosibacter sp.]